MPADPTTSPSAQHRADPLTLRRQCGPGCRSGAAPSGKVEKSPATFAQKFTSLVHRQESIYSRRFPVDPLNPSGHLPRSRRRLLPRTTGTNSYGKTRLDVWSNGASIQNPNRRSSRIPGHSCSARVLEEPNARATCRKECHPPRKSPSSRNSINIDRCHFGCPCGLDVHRGFDERRGDLRHDCIAVAPQESHTAGYPMSQRECAGFNWPVLLIGAVDPVSVSPPTTATT